MRYDVVIVGAGPAGVSTALAIKELNKDKSVLLLEKGKKPHSICAGGLSSVLAEKAGIEMRKEFLEQKIKRVVLDSEGETTEIRGMGTIGYTISRERFDEFLLKKAVKEGVEFRKNSLVETVAMLKDFTSLFPMSIQKPKGMVFLKDDIIEGRIVVGADGPLSKVRESVFPRAKPEFHLGIQEFVRAKDFCEDTIYLYFNRRTIPFGYGWVFPSKDGVFKVGLGTPLLVPAIDSAYYQGTSTALHFEKFKKRFKIRGRVLRKQAALIPITCPMKSVVKGNVALVGDAARQTDSLTGGGIINAVVAAKLLGQTIANDEPLHNYNKKYGEGLFKQLRFRYSLKKVFTSFDNRDLDFLLELLSSYDLKSCDMNKEIKGFLLHILLRKPSLLFKGIKTLWR